MVFASMLTEEQKAAIADVAIESAQLEVEIDRCIIDLCRLWWPHGTVLLEKAHLKGKLDILETLISTEFPKDAIPAGFSFAFNQLRNLNKQRNTIVHGEWMLKSMSAENFDSIHPGSLRKDVEHKNIVVANRRKREKLPQPVPAKNIRKTAELMALNRQLLHQLFWEHFSDRVRGISGLPTSPEIPSQCIEAAIRARGQSRK